MLTVRPVLLFYGWFPVYYFRDYKGSLDRPIVFNGTYNITIHEGHAIKFHGAPVLLGWMHRTLNGHTKFRLVSQNSDQLNFNNLPYIPSFYMFPPLYVIYS